MMSKKLHTVITWMWAACFAPQGIAVEMCFAIFLNIALYFLPIQELLPCAKVRFAQDIFSSGNVPPCEVGALTVAVGTSQHQGVTFSWGCGKWMSFAEAGELGSGTLKMVGGGGPVLECGDIKIVRWEPPGRQIQGWVMPTLPKQRKKWDEECKPFGIPGHSILRWKLWSYFGFVFNVSFPPPSCYLSIFGSNLALKQFYS